ncbi:pentapeptide repeat-containing protein [Amycolatopsis sp. VS8301801F10]|uniref:pentapeptide repeat-containing protein n=1 Tax=Amycolatopsis sp. VS8301801F10 TaxID=2652442 RepID=UPI0038FCFA21
MRLQKWRGAGAAAATVLVLGAVVWFFGVPVPEWAVGPAEGLTRQEWLTAVGNARSSLLTGLSVAAGIVTAGLGVRRYFQDRDKQRLEEDKHLTSQFDAAWTRLASEDPLIRANAVRTLFRLMIRSEQDRPLVLRSVCDLLRQRVGDDADLSRPAPDVTAAVDALRERAPRAEPDPLDLTGVRLPGTDFRGASLRGARFGRTAVLSEADLTGADLREATSSGLVLKDAALPSALLSHAALDRADFRHANLRDADARAGNFAEADFRNADLSGADFRGAALRRARFSGAKLDRAALAGADLTDTDLSGVDLTTTTGLTRETLSRAVVKDAVLPGYLEK